MKTKQLFPLLVAALPLSLLLAADDVPKSFEFARYQGMLDRSPFAIATAAAPAPAATPNFAKDFYVANAARSADGGLVTIASSADKNFKLYLTTNEAKDGYKIANIEWSEKVGATKVTITKDGQTATLSFNEALLRQPLASGQNLQPQQPQVQPQPLVQPPPGAVPQPNVQKPMPVPSLPTPPPRVRGVIPRNPVVPMTPVPAPTPAEVEL